MIIESFYHIVNLGEIKRLGVLSGVDFSASDIDSLIVLSNLNGAQVRHSQSE